MNSGEVPTYEWWPDYGGGPFFLRTGRGGEKVELATLNLTGTLEDAIRAWNQDFEEAKLPIDGPGDHSWIARGIDLLDQTRQELSGRVKVVVTEPWWNEEPSEN